MVISCSVALAKKVVVTGSQNGVFSEHASIRLQWRLKPSTVASTEVRGGMAPCAQSGSPLPERLLVSLVESSGNPSLPVQRLLLSPGKDLAPGGGEPSCAVGDGATSFLA